MRKTRYITDAGMITALLIVFLLISRFAGGFVEEMLTFTLPVPVALYTLKYDIKKGLLPASAISLLSFLIINPISAACFIIPANIVGLIYGSILKKPINIKIKLSVLIVGALIINILTTVVFSKILFGYTIIEDTQILVDQISSFFATLKMNSEILSFIEALLIGLIPSILILISIFEGFLTHMVTSLLANRIFKIEIKGTLVGFKLAVPRLASYFILPLLILMVFLLPKYAEISGIYHIFLVILLNITFLFLMIYLIQGFAVASLYVAKKTAKGMLILVFLAIFIFPYLLILIGLLDSFFDLKTRILLKK